MVTYDSYRPDLERRGAELSGAGRAAYYLGLGLGKTVRFVTFPFRALAGRTGGRPGARIGRLPGGSAGSRVFSTLKRMHDRVRRLEDEVRAHGTPTPSYRSEAAGGPAVDDPAVVVLEAMQHPDPSVRCEAADAAGSQGLTSCVFSLILLLDDPEPRVRDRAVVAIGAITGRKLRLKGSADEIRGQIDELKDWWKKERFNRLAAELETVVRT